MSWPALWFRAWKSISSETNPLRPGCVYASLVVEAAARPCTFDHRQYLRSVRLRTAKLTRRSLQGGHCRATSSVAAAGMVNCVAGALTVAEQSMSDAVLAACGAARIAECRVPKDKQSAGVATDAKTLKLKAVIKDPRRRATST